MKKGMTLVEIMVSLIILAFVLGAIYTILNLQTVRSQQVQKTSILQTDAQVALSLMKWDLATAGLAYPKQDDAVQSLNGGANASDGITVRAVMLGFEAGRCMWSWLMDDVLNSNILLVRAFADSSYYFHIGDTIVVVDLNRVILDPPGFITVQANTPDTFYDPYGSNFLVQRLTVSDPVSAVRGLVVIGYISSIYNPGLTFAVNNGQLMRGTEIMLDNVEDLQFSYGIDNDDDAIIETWTDNIPAFAASNRKWAIRYTLVLTSRTMPGYTYPDDSVAIEDHIYALDDVQKKQKRAILSGIIAPQNLQP